MAGSPESFKIMTFQPSWDQFKDLPKYIAEMEKMGANKAGIAKVIPPKGWRPNQNSDDCTQYENIDIEHPNLQTVVGSQGVYQQYWTNKSCMKVKDFKLLAEKRSLKTPAHKTHKELDDIYWNSLTKNHPIYGSGISASLFDKNVENWNLQSLNTILDHVMQEDGLIYEGINTPYLYFGMWKTSFAWHTEDCDLYSINFLHFGEPKVWWVIPPAYGKPFEDLVKTLFPANCQTCPAFLRHKTTIISPDVLKKHSIPYSRVSQNKGEFIVTFPSAYHAGYNAGFNCAEAINFASVSWIDYGKVALKCSCKRMPIISLNMDKFVELYQPHQYEEWLKDKTLKEKHHKLLHKNSNLSLNKRGGCNGLEQNINVDQLTEEWATPLKLLWCRMDRNFNVEKSFNYQKSLCIPHCAICSIFTFKDDGLSSLNMPTKSIPRIHKVFFTNRYFYKPIMTSSQLLTCASCKVCVHASCYTVPEESTINEEWRCQRCLTENTAVDCMLCKLRGGAFKQLSNGFWIHVVCAIVTWNRCFTDNYKIILGTQAMESRRCSFCHGLFAEFTNDFSYLYTVQCDYNDCNQCFHVTCAAAALVQFTICNSPPFQITKMCLKHKDVINAAQKKVHETTLNAAIGECVLAENIDGRHHFGEIVGVTRKTMLMLDVHGSLETIELQNVLTKLNMENIVNNKRIKFQKNNKLKIGIYKEQVSTLQYEVKFKDQTTLTLTSENITFLSQDVKNKFCDQVSEEGITSKSSVESSNFSTRPMAKEIEVDEVEMVKVVTKLPTVAVVQPVHISVEAIVPPFEDVVNADPTANKNRFKLRNPNNNLDPAYESAYNTHRNFKNRQKRKRKRQENRVQNQWNWRYY